MRLRVALPAALALTFFDVACSKVPTVPQQAAVASYTAALQTCVATAEVTDAGFAGYAACRDGVDRQYGRAPEDGGE